MNCYILIRKFSDYYSGMTVLGIFSTLDYATNAKNEYIDKTKNNDPHNVPPYHYVDLKVDVKIYKASVDNLTENIYFLIHYMSMFGQEVHQIKCISSSHSHICTIYDKIKEDDVNHPVYYWDMVTVNTLRDKNNFNDMEGG